MTEPLNDNNLNIECDWMKTKKLLINPDGQVLPCCYFANVIYMYDKMNSGNDFKDISKESKYLLDKNESVEERVKRRTEFESDISKQIGDKSIINKQTKDENVLMNYYRNREKYNIFENDIESIINSEWFVKTLPESWNDEKSAPRQCKKHCQVKDE
jgi:hypothetical protein